MYLLAVIRVYVFLCYNILANQASTKLAECFIYTVSVLE